MLHGALGAQTQLESLKNTLSASFEVHCLDFYGHGSDTLSNEPFRIAGFAEQVNTWLEEKQIERISIFGYSMGGYVALYLASKFPGKVNRIFTLATKFDWNPEAAEKETGMLDPEKIASKIPLFASELSDRHGAHYWKNVLRKTADMMLELGREKALSDDEITRLEIPVLVAVGDRDPMVSITETATVAKQLKNGALLVVPNTVHPLEKVALARLVFECEQFFGVKA